MIGLGAVSGHQWFPEDAEVGANFVGRRSFTGNHFLAREIVKAGRSSKPFRRSKLPGTLVVSVIMMALAYLVICCGKKFALKHPVPRDLDVAASDLGPAASCSGGDHEEQEERQESEEGQLKAWETSTSNELGGLAVTAQRAIKSLHPQRRMRASSLLLRFAFSELAAFVSFLGSQLEKKKTSGIAKV